MLFNKNIKDVIHSLITYFFKLTVQINLNVSIQMGSSKDCLCKIKLIGIAFKTLFSRCSHLGSRLGHNEWWIRDYLIRRLWQKDITNNDFIYNFFNSPYLLQNKIEMKWRCLITKNNILKGLSTDRDVTFKLYFSRPK